ncbi:MAG TPA: hypothetical protein VGK59_20075 [Ohtaekwangia sp.]
MKEDVIISFRKRAFRVCIVVAALHISACFYFAIFQTGPFSKTALGSFYKQRFIIGPFFLADRLKTSPHLLVRYKQPNREWSGYTDEAADKFGVYLDKPWHYNDLAEADFVRFIGRKLTPHHSSDSVWKTREFIALNSYIIREVLPPDHVDSIRVAYVLNTYDSKADHIRSDTSWTLTYKLNDQSVR